LFFAGSDDCDRRVCGREWESFCFWAVLGGSLLLLAGKGTALFVARGVSVWLGLRVVFGFLFLFLFLWMDEAGKPSLAPWCRGLPVKAGIFGMNMCVFVGSCNAEKLVFG
jgi:hypothetical protein